MHGLGKVRGCLRTKIRSRLCPDVDHSDPGVTNVPRPVKVTTRPSARSTSSAARTVPRATSYVCANVTSPGSLCPGGHSPLSILARSTRSAVSGPGALRLDTAGSQDSSDLFTAIAGHPSDLADARTASISRHDGGCKPQTYLWHIGTRRSNLRETILHALKRCSVRLRRRLKVTHHVATLTRTPHPTCKYANEATYLIYRWPHHR